MSETALKQRLQHLLKRPAAPRLKGDQGFEVSDRLRPAAVLIGLVDRPAGPTILLTQRTEHLSAHAGQISFPGGRMEPEDADAAATALREAQEEIGLDPAKVELLGEVPPYTTITGFRVHPIVGWIEPPVTFAIDPIEVAELFEVPLAFVLDKANHRQGSREHGGRRRQFYVLPFERRYIWGATAAMLVNFAERLDEAGHG